MINIIKKCLVIVFIAMVYIVNASQMNSLYSDHRAMKVDDILTVLVVENASASDQSATNTAKDNSMTVSGTAGKATLPAIGAGSNVSYDGKGGTSRQGNLAATVSARVVKVLDNGNLVIEGSKNVVINEEKEIIKIDGVVRPQDVMQNNMIYSSNIADAQITYSGKGVSTTGQRPGFFARLFNWVF